MKLNDAAEKVRRSAGLDPDTIISIIETITQIFASCPKRNARFFQENGKEQNLLARRVTVRAVQRNMDVGRGEAQRIAYHILDTCSTLPESDIKSVMNELEGNQGKVFVEDDE